MSVLDSASRYLGSAVIAAKLLFDMRKENQPNFSWAGNSMKIALQPFLEKMGVRRDLFVTESNVSSVCCAEGSNFFHRHAGIHMLPNLYSEDKDVALFLAKHEISHIKHNDLFWIPCVNFICAIGVAIFLPSDHMSREQALALIAVISFVAMCLYSQYVEQRADRVAIQESSQNELEGGLVFFEWMRGQNRTMRARHWIYQVILSPSGENRLDFLHPSFASRIKQVQNEINTRSLSVSSNYSSRLSNFRRAFQIG